jgi:hypothetical protein
VNCRVSHCDKRINADPGTHREVLTFDPFHPMRASARPRPASAASVVMTLSLAIAVGVLLLVFYRPLESTAQGVAARSGISRLVLVPCPPDN